MRLAVINYDFCKPDKCSTECISYCPIDRSGGNAIELAEIVKGKPVIYEQTCIGCGICVKKCPFEAITVINLPDQYEGDVIHRYGINGFKLFGIPTLKEGFITGILGKNGTGKTTMLKIISGELLPNFGDVDSQPSQENVLKRFKGKEMYGYFEKLYSKELKVAHKIQYVEYAGKFLKGSVSEILKKADQRGRIDEIKSLLSMERFWDKDCKVLSGGELQKLLIAAALARDADVYVFDEPSSYLDVRERTNMAKAIRELTKGKYVVLVEHDLVVLDYLADFINIVYGEGSIYGKVSKVYSSRVGINNFLNGFLPTENMKIRQDKIDFVIKELSDLDFAKDVKEKVTWTEIYKNNSGFKLKVNAGNAREGEIIGIVGPNGIGKTTFVKMLVGEYKPDIGEVTPDTLRLSYKPQVISPNSDLTVKEYLENVSKDILSNSSWFYVEVIRRLGLHRLLESVVNNLSGGELQKLLIAAALARDADVYVFDEPSSYLDVEERYIVAKAIKKISRERKSVTFVVEHDLSIHDYIADRIMVFLGTPSIEGEAIGPLSIREGMNTFLKSLGITFRRDAETGRPRVNKIDSYLDRIQKEKGEYYSIAKVSS
ncbi:ribosome biogenesis/translation initiation ATPase RLI [Sulfuracidifex metallicus]|uniref:Ribosome biogenesis/translation initiation ATPase RLI n=1 Tax=Sulfuracidifex metallicus DSM 6482 = JCM 9184 TaxID=523847 RepID=A0A6A9QN54_SULME|nr:ribosome biogenesis/translation initiation ATPase RLI [Sulfuracidifex metallicus]MUN28621.1 ribosome biogenesis/translation initiation ATPase RLI [Sulfuracidifex metallicus DSM 6482 = JCM 9184]WOE50850.1 ribosome biogenesis/translation initiation ATPase RLI [Sulfuracidifex metallicus DSM 6482 = JCM 9184]